MAGYSFELRARIRHVGAGKMPRRMRTVETEKIKGEETKRRRDMSLCSRSRLTRIFHVNRANLKCNGACCSRHKEIAHPPVDPKSRKSMSAIRCAHHAQLHQEGGILPMSYSVGTDRRCTLAWISGVAAIASCRWRECLQLGGACQAQFAQNVFAMLAHGQVAEVKRTCDLLAGVSRQHVRQHLLLARRQRER